MRPAAAANAAVAAALAALITACSPNQEPAPPTTTTNPPAAAAPAAGAGTTTTAASSGQANQMITITVSGGTVNPPPAPVDVKLGSTVVIQVTSDVADVIHVQGYEMTQQLQAGQPGLVQVRATIPGRFVVSLANAKLPLVALVVS